MSMAEALVAIVALICVTTLIGIWIDGRNK